MPQLEVGTFCSQIFWILIGFMAVYSFVSRVIVIRIEETLDSRNAYIDALSEKAKELSSEAGKLEREAFVALENAEIESAAAESKLMASFREQSIKEKNILYGEFSKKSKIESEKLRTAVNDSFNEISENMNDIVNMAMNSISRFTVSKGGRNTK